MSKIITAKSITDTDLESIESTSGSAGDVEMAAIARLARVGEFDGDDWALDTDERKRIDAMSQDQAIARCVELMLDAAGR